MKTGIEGVVLAGKIAAAAVTFLVPLLLLAAFLGQLASFLLNQATPTPVWGGASIVVQAALTLQSKIYGPNSNLYDPADPIMQRVEGYWKTYCNDGQGGLCELARPGDLQCVQFATAAYWLAGSTLPSIQNAEDFWPAYEHTAGWIRIPSPSSFPVAFQPPALGDLVIWKGGGFYDKQGIWQEYGHIAVVVGYQPPRGNTSGFLEVAEANAPGNKFADPNAYGNTYRMTVHPDGHIDTWPSYSILGFLRNTTIPTMTTPSMHLPAGPSMNNDYVKYAWAAAQKAGINPDIFIRQIQQESGFNPRAISSAGAEGIAQFMPLTAAGITNPLGSGMLDPWNPDQALTAAAQLMAAQVQAYGGDYAKALASYNAGDGEVQSATSEAIRIDGTPTTWQKYLPQETQQYLLKIIGS